MAKVLNGVETLPKFKRLSRVHERYRQTTDRQTDGRQHIANVNMSSRSLKVFRIRQAVRNDNSIEEKKQLKLLTRAL